MSTPFARSSDDITGIVCLLILGAGFVALFADIDYFYVIWILGFAVVLPIIAILLGENEDDETDEWTFEDTTHEAEHDSATDAQTSSSPSSSSSTQVALSTLRERYASGDLTDDQFERKLDRLLETETPENAAEWRERATREVETES